MTTHIFLGAGPANLDRALRILNQDPDEKLIIIDKRIDKSGQFTGANLRANILLLDKNYVNELRKLGVKKSTLKSKGVWRKINQKNGFNDFDRMVLPHESGLQISIGDLQNILIKTIISKSTGEQLEIIRTSLKNDDELSLINQPNIDKEVLQKLFKKAGINPSSGDQDIEIHIASGSFGENSPKDLINYPPRARYEYSEASIDLRYMFVEQTHGAVTFKFNPYMLELADHSDHIRPLDEFEWRGELAPLGWNLSRPPQVRLFYTHDHIYLGMEIPASWEKLYIKDKKAYQEQLINYGRRIAKLMIVIISKELDEMEANRDGVNAPSFFKTNRGETGIVAKSLPDSNVSLFIHGDARYLPHYQSSSGIIIASDINKLWVNIRRQSFEDLILWGIERGYIRYEIAGPKSIKFMDRLEDFTKTDLNNIKKRYIRQFQDNTQTLTNEEIEKRALQAFRIELFIYASHQLIENNKDKVQTYFRNLITQSIHSLTDRRFFEIISAHINMPDKYVDHLKDIPSDARRLDNRLKEVRFIDMLMHFEIELLKTVLPELINFDFSDSLVNNDFIERIRQSFANSNKGRTLYLISGRDDAVPIHNHVHYILFRYPKLKPLILHMLLESSYFESNPISAINLSETFKLYRSIGKAEELFDKLLDSHIQLDSIIPDYRTFNDFYLTDDHQFTQITRRYRRFDKRLIVWLLSSESRFSHILSSQNLIINFVGMIIYHPQTDLLLDLLCENNSLIHHFLPEPFALDEYKTIITGKERTVLRHHLRNYQELFKSQPFFKRMIQYGAKENVGLFFSYTVRNENRGFGIDDITRSDTILNTQNIEILEALLIWFVEEKVKSSDSNHNMIFYPLERILTQLKECGSKNLICAKPLFEKVFAATVDLAPYWYSKYNELHSRYLMNKRKPEPLPDVESSHNSGTLTGHEDEIRLSTNQHTTWQNQNNKKRRENNGTLNTPTP